MPRILKRPMFSRGGRIGLAEGDPNPGMMGGLGSALPKEKYKPDLMTIKATLNQVYTNAGGSEDGSGYAAVLNFMKENPEYKVQILENMIGDKGNQIRVAPLEKESVNILDSLNEDMDGIIKIDMDKLGGRLSENDMIRQLMMNSKEPNSRLSEKDIQRQLMMNPSEPNSRLSEKDIQRQQLLQESNKGIMTGLVDRTEKNQGGRIGLQAGSPFTEERTSADVKAMMDAMNQYAPVTKQRLNLGKVGLNLAAGKYSGGDLISSLAGAGSDIYDDYTTKDDAYRAAIDKRKQAAVSSSLSQQLAERKALATATGKIPTSKKARNTSDQVINGVAPGQVGFFTNQMINALGGKLTPIDERMVTISDGKGGTTTMPYVEYKLQNTIKYKNETTAKALGTEYNILNGLVDRMVTQVPETKTGAVGYGFRVVEALSDQFSQVAEQLGVKENWKEDDYDENVVDSYLAKKGFATSLEEGATSSAIMKGAVINLAYALAKIAEPGNPKLSEGDIIRQLDRINYGSSRNTFAKGLTELLEQEKIRASETIEGFNLKPSDYLKITGDKKEKSKKKNYVIVDGEAFEIIDGKRVKVIFE